MDLADALALPRPTTSTYEATRRHASTGPSLDTHAARSCTCSATRSTPYPVIHVTGTNGKGSTARMIIDPLLEATA